MLNEVKTLFENIKHFRKLLLKEEVGENAIVDAINKRKIIYIYYVGDKNNKRGYRTIRPMVYGITKAGNGVVRAWQEAGASDSAKIGNRYPDAKGRMKPGWRLFRVDAMTSFLPTGKFFSNDPKKIPPDYNSNDKQIYQILAAVEPQNKGQVDVSGLDVIDEPSTVKAQIPAPPKSVFNDQVKRFKYFSDAARKTREATKEEIENLYQIAKKIRKKSPSQMLVVQDENGDMVIKDKAIEDKLPPESIVGNLDNLYKKMVATQKPVSTAFRERKLDDTLKKMN